MLQLCISVKLKNLKANHNKPIHFLSQFMLCISVKLKNLKANHNANVHRFVLRVVVYIRKVKKSESKSQHLLFLTIILIRCVYP